MLEWGNGEDPAVGLTAGQRPKGGNISYLKYRFSHLIASGKLDHVSLVFRQHNACSQNHPIFSSSLS